MSRLLPIVILTPLLFAGCAQYARLEQVEMGMTVDDFLALPTPVYYRGTTEDTLQYGARLNVPSGPSLSRRSIRPYIFTFEEGKLTEISFDEEEQKRQELRKRLHFGYGYGHRRYFLHRHHYFHP